MKIGVDVDGTVAQYGGPKAYRPGVIGDPLPRLAKVKEALRAGHDVVWFSTRANLPRDRAALRDWSREHLGRSLPMTQDPSGIDEVWDSKFPGGKLRLKGPEDVAKMWKLRSQPENPGPKTREEGGMPYSSQAQRGFFRAAENKPAMRKRLGLKLEDVKAMNAEDKPGKLPKYAPGADGILIAISKRPGRGPPMHGEVNAMRRDIGKALIEAVKSGDADRVAECLDLAANLRDELREDMRGESEGEPGEESEGYEE